MPELTKRRKVVSVLFHLALFLVLPLVIPLFFVLFLLFLTASYGIALEIFGPIQMPQTGVYVFLGVCWLLLAFFYFFLTLRITKDSDSFSFPLVTFATLISSLISFSVMLVGCLLSGMEGPSCDPNRYYNLSGVLKFSAIPLTAYLAFLVARLFLIVKKKEIINRASIVYPLLAIVLSVLIFGGYIKLLTEIPVIWDKQRAKKVAEINALPYLTVNDLTFRERRPPTNSSDWGTYSFSKYLIKYPTTNLKLVTTGLNPPPEDLYFYYSDEKPSRYLDSRGLTVNRFFQFDLGYQILNYRTTEEAIDSIL